jgi:hypothetical protein
MMIRVSLLAAFSTVLVFSGCGDRAKPSPVKIGAVADSPPKSVSRANVEATIKLFAKNLGERYRTDAKWAERFKAEDGESVNEVLRLACKENGITQEEYEWALAEDKSLHELQQTAIAGALANK